MKRTTTLSIFIVAILILIPLAAMAEPPYKVKRVIDGDSIILLYDTNELRVRLVGIDAPEKSRKKHHPGQPFSQSSTKHLAGLILGKAVQLKKYGADRYGRILGEIYLNKTNINLEMVKAGLAEVYRGRPASGMDMAAYWKAEQASRKAKTGMWTQGDRYMSPKQWRKNQRNQKKRVK